MLHRSAAEPDLIRLLRAIGFAAVAAAGCSSGGGLPLAHDGGADGSFEQQTTVSFVNDVYPIVAASCALVGCHELGTVTNHMTDYTTAEKTHARWVNGPGFDFCTDGPDLFVQRVIVVPGDPDASYLVTKIAPSTDVPCQDPTHHRRMPPDPLAPLGAEAIAKIVQWIREGALLN
jgi:hypothetical protein